MPSRPLSADTSVVVKLHTRIDNEAMDIAKGRTEMAAAVARLAQLIPPARVDLVDEVLVGVGRRDLSVTLDWPPINLVHQLAYRVKRVHLGEVRMRGPNGEVVDVIPLPGQARLRPALLPAHPARGVHRGVQDAGGAGQGGQPRRASGGRPETERRPASRELTCRRDSGGLRC